MVQVHVPANALPQLYVWNTRAHIMQQQQHLVHPGPAQIAVRVRRRAAHIRHVTSRLAGRARARNLPPSHLDVVIVVLVQPHHCAFFIVITFPIAAGAAAARARRSGGLPRLLLLLLHRLCLGPLVVRAEVGRVQGSR